MRLQSFNYKINMMLRITIIATIASLVLFSCTKKIEQEVTNNPSPNSIAPNGFLFTTTRTVHFTINVQSVAATALTRVPIVIYQYDDGQIGKELFRGYSGTSGTVSGTFQLTKTSDSVVIDPAYIGLIRNALAVVTNNRINCTIGGSNLFSGSIVGTVKTNTVNNRVSSNFKSNDINGVTTSTKFSYLGSYDIYGRPTNLLTPDFFSDPLLFGDLLYYINAALPEGLDLRKTNPQFLASDNASNIVLTKDAEVFVTFLSEGAGFRNSIGFYSYPTNSPPKSLADIKQINFIFPNASFLGSNGSMLPGDKISLGKFSAGTTVAFVLYSNGWNGSQVDVTSPAYFTDAFLNPEKDPSLQKHSVLLKYQNTYLIGFKDLDRSLSICDHDFNDVIIYASANPIDAISNNKVVSLTNPTDTDGDGIVDTIDQFPTDPNRAFINYYPAKDSWSTIAFEDKWPIFGDYDMNDVVVNYNYSWVSNANNDVVEMYANFQPIANGATFQDGFGIQFPFSSSNVASVTGASTTANYIKFNNNGTEAGQTNAVIIPFDNMRSILSYPSGAFFVNTDMNLPKVTGTTINMKISFTSPIDIGYFDNVPFNPFIISNLRRGFEVHLPGQLPTALADKTQFGQGIDATNTATGVYYVTKQNYPWAINFTSPFIYPIERASIADAYPNFLKWASSGGTQFNDWFINTSIGYRNTNLLYTK